MKKNFIKQEGIKDCGPACLSMIISHYKGYIDISELKEMCKTNRDGTSAYQLIKVAKQIGFEAYGVKCKLEEMNEENMILPCIAYIIINNSYKHYVIIDNINHKTKTLIIKDPASKVKKYSFSEFEKIYKNILIVLYPIKKIPHQSKYSMNKFINNIIKSSKKQLIEVIIISFFITLFAIISSFYLQFMIDNMISKNKLIFIFLIFLIIYLLKIISDYFRNKILIIINQKIDIELTDETFKQIIFSPYCYFKNNTTGEIVSKISDLESVRQVISKVALSIFIDLPLTIIALITMYIININLFIIAIIILLLYLLIIMIFRNKFSELVNNCQEKKAETTSYMVESINGFESIKGCNKENYFINKFEKKYINHLKEIENFDNSYNYQYLFKELINNIGFIIIVVIGIFEVINNNITIGQLLSFTTLLNYFLEPIRNIIDLDASIKQAKNALHRITKLYFKKDNKVIKRNVNGDIIFNNLTYSFDDITNVLNNVNIKIKQESKVMVIGSSGSGKSTLFKILKKYYEIPRDKVYINNMDLNDIDNKIVYISQNETLFTDTMMNNIGKLTDASEICKVDDIVKKMPLGYHTLIEENGFNLSGGEKQRIVLARALNCEFDILIIDEGLNQVDTNMERQIIKNILAKYKNKTIIFISHRYDNKDLFDSIINVEKGVVELVSKNR